MLANVVRGHPAGAGRTAHRALVAFVACLKVAAHKRALVELSEMQIIAEKLALKLLLDRGEMHAERVGHKADALLLDARAP